MGKTGLVKGKRARNDDSLRRLRLLPFSHISTPTTHQPPTSTTDQPAPAPVPHFSTPTTHRPPTSTHPLSWRHLSLAIANQQRARAFAWHRNTDSLLTRLCHPSPALFDTINMHQPSCYGLNIFGLPARSPTYAVSYGLSTPIGFPASNITVSIDLDFPRDCPQDFHILGFPSAHPASIWSRKVCEWRY
ncbi:hypothetical protein BJ912DRAFT_1061072 [Pholiota molesta]|nr:hypothetical protein BJ912DRAFT_1061072 [Pholiota molesta]